MDNEKICDECGKTNNNITVCPTCNNKVCELCHGSHNHDSKPYPNAPINPFPQIPSNFTIEFTLKKDYFNINSIFMHRNVVVGQYCLNSSIGIYGEWGIRVDFDGGWVSHKEIASWRK